MTTGFGNKNVLAYLDEQFGCSDGGENLSELGEELETANINISVKGLCYKVKK